MAFPTVDLTVSLSTSRRFERILWRVSYNDSSAFAGTLP